VGALLTNTSCACVVSKITGEMVMLGRTVFVLFFLFVLSACTSPKLQNLSGGPHDPSARECVVLYVPLGGYTERDAYALASRRCSPKVATKVWHDYSLLFPLDANRIGYRCD